MTTPKIIVLLADGTGNSAAKLFKTNVWRLYKALDVSDRPPAGQARQVAYYHDGVGTSTFKPLTLLGGIFGIGLKRNVIDLYTFLCRNYLEGDRIYAYGFSRGAFTIRVLAGLVLSQGILQCRTEEELKRYTADAYRHYRRGYKLPIFKRKDKTRETDPEETVGLVDILRNVRDAVLKVYRHVRRIPQYDEIGRTKDVAIDFIGVWDTVAAYGLPIDEMTRGIDEWVWPLSMPNYTLDPKVLRARHALALDDERDTFHPLLWDETAEARFVEERKVAPGRLQQVWFAGVHSNVGGGYADDALSYVPLQWMMEESEQPIPDRQGQAQPGLRFLPPDQREPLLPPDDFSRLYDSRSGIGAYYRYQPRRIAARLENPSAHTLMMQDPNRKGKGFLKRVQVHESVFHRAKAGNDRYAPVVLPDAYEVVRFDRTVTNNTNYPPPPAHQLEWVWNDIWRRRVNYFMTVVITAILVAFPLIQVKWPPSACVGPQCLLTPVIETIGAFLPGFVQPWISAFAISPGWFLVVAVIILVHMVRSSYLKRSVHDGMREVWALSLGLRLGPERPATAAGLSTGLPNRGADRWIYRLRTAPWYQKFFQWLKWRGIPGVFGAGVLLGGTLLVLALILVVVQRGRIAYAERSNAFCNPGVTAAAPSGSGSAVLNTNALCSATGIRVQKGKRYRLTMQVTQNWVDGTASMPDFASNPSRWYVARVTRGWMDRTISTTPAGYEASRLRWYMRPSILFRRSLSGDWLSPVLKVIPPSGRGGHVQVLEMRCACGQGGDVRTAGAPPAARPVYTADFEAVIDGDVFVYVNDIVTTLVSEPTYAYYSNNQGAAEVRIDQYPD